MKTVEFITSKFGIPFCYGKNDCALFVCEIIDMLHGTNYYEKYFGMWDCKKTAMEYAKTHKLKVVEVLKSLKYKKIDPKTMRMNDIVILKQSYHSGWLSAGICLGDSIAVMTIKGIGFTKQNKLMPNIVEVLRCHKQ